MSIEPTFLSVVRSTTVGRAFISVLLGGLVFTFVIREMNPDFYYYFMSDINSRLGEDAAIVALLTGGLAAWFTLFFLRRSDTIYRAPTEDSSHTYSEQLQQQVAGLDLAVKRLAARDESTGAIDPDKLDELISGIEARVVESAEQAVSKSVLHQFEAEVAKSARLSVLRTGLKKTVERLESETALVRGRSNLNLAYGAFLTVTGLALLGVTVFSLQSFSENATNDIVAVQPAAPNPAAEHPAATTTLKSNPPELAGTQIQTTASYLLRSFVPRVTLVVFLQIFALFFLRLYRSGLSEARHLSNEVTNIEARQTALEAALIQEDMESIRGVIADLSKTDRNSVAAIYGAKTDRSNYQLQLSRLKELYGTVGAMLGKSQ